MLWLVTCSLLLRSLVFQEFIKMTNHDVAHTIRKHMSGDVRDAFVAIGQFPAVCSVGKGGPGFYCVHWPTMGWCMALWGSLPLPMQGVPLLGYANHNPL